MCACVLEKTKIDLILREKSVDWNPLNFITSMFTGIFSLLKK